MSAPQDRKCGPRPKYPFAGLPVGGRFSVPLAGEQHVKGGDMALHRVSRAAAHRRAKHGGQFRTRTARAEGVVICERVQ